MCGCASLSTPNQNITLRFILSLGNNYAQKIWKHPLNPSNDINHKPVLESDWSKRIFHLKNTNMWLSHALLALYKYLVVRLCVRLKPCKGAKKKQNISVDPVYFACKTLKLASSSVLKNIFLFCFYMNEFDKNSFRADKRGMYNSWAANTLHKIWSFPLRISSVNVAKSTVAFEFGHIYWINPQWKTSFFV